MTQKELAKAINYSVTYISDMETGRTVPAVKTLLLIAEALDVSIGILFDEQCCFSWMNEKGYCKYQKTECESCPIYGLREE